MCGNPCAFETLLPVVSTTLKASGIWGLKLKSVWNSRASKNFPSIVSNHLIAQGIVGEKPKMYETLATGNFEPAVGKI